MPLLFVTGARPYGSRKYNAIVFVFEDEYSITSTFVTTLN